MTKIKVGIQKSGRLYEESIKLLKDAGISIEDGLGRLKVVASNFPMEVFFLRNSDIPEYLKDGVIDIAIVGSNLLVEKQTNAEIITSLGFSKCRVSIAVPKDFNYKSIKDLQGLRVATSYPNTVKQFFKKNKVNLDIHQISGSVEIAPNIGLADAIVDIVSSGSTLFKNSLKEVDVILNSEAVLAMSPLISKALKDTVLKQIQFRLDAVLRSRHTKYVLLNAPNDKLLQVVSMLPMMRSPTIIPLAQEGWSSVQSVIEEDKIWDVIHQLKNAGAEDILICPIEKIVL